MRVVCIIQARMGSSRLPGKSLRALRGRPLIAHVIERAKAIPGVDRVVLATSIAPRDEPLGVYVESLNVPVFYGDELDVLRRYAQAAAEHQADVIMRVTGDCPFLAPEVADEVLRMYHTNPLGATFASNDTTFSGYPDGTDVEIFSRELLDVANAAATDQSDREHVTKWMRREVCTATLQSDTDWSRYKISVDRAEDYDLAVQLADRLPPTDYSLDATMRVLQELMP
jgi:spore coat polysaccharide biosynthesis protein SpsF (cytidylyltransferase family)